MIQEVKDGQCVSVNYVFILDDDSEVEILIGEPTADQTTIGQKTYIEKSYLSTKSLVERLDLIDPAPENYWTKTLPDIKKKIQALPYVEEALLEGGDEDGE